MNELLTKYGYCVLEKGTRLWTIKTGPFELIDAPVFFYLQSEFDKESMHGETTYAFEVVNPITCLCPLFMQRSQRCFTFFKNIFEDEMNESWNYRSNINMKTYLPARNKLITFLKSQNIQGWVSPEEFSLYKVEALIIEPHKKLTYIGQVKSNNALYNIVKPVLGSIVDDESFYEILRTMKKQTKQQTIFDTTF